MDDHPVKMLHLKVTGRVQGVGFRYYTYDAALDHGIVGWVRNRPDRSVEILAQGPSRQLDAFVDAVRRGPPSSRVDEVLIRPATDKKKLTSFDIKLF